MDLKWLAGTYKQAKASLVINYERISQKTHSYEIKLDYNYDNKVKNIGICQSEMPVFFIDFELNIFVFYHFLYKSKFQWFYAVEDTL